MPKYLLAYHGGGEMPSTAEEQEQELADWLAWFGKLGGAIVDVGNPMSGSVTVGPDGAASEGGGANPVTGYSLITAADRDAAVEMVQGCPVLASGGSVEVAETIAMTPEEV